MSDVVVDNNVLTSVKQYVTTQVEPSWFHLSSFAQMLELLVLADRLFVDEMSMHISGTDDFLTSLHPEMANVIAGLGVSDRERGAAVSFAQNHADAYPDSSLDEWSQLALLRGHFYLLLATSRGLPYFPSQQRASYLSALEPASSDVAVFARVAKAFERLRYEAYSVLRQSGDFAYRYRPLPYPPLFAFMVNRAANMRELFEIAIDMRESRHARSFRRWCADLVAAEQEERWTDAGKMFIEVEAHLRAIVLGDSPVRQAELQLSFPPAIGIAARSSDRQARQALALSQAGHFEPAGVTAA